MSTRLKIARTILIAVTVAVVLIPPTIYFLIKTSEKRAWNEMRRWCDQTAAEVRARPSERPVLRGVPVPGNAWDDYGEGLGSLPKQWDLYPAAVYLSSSSDSGVDKVAELLRLHASAIDALGRGASRASARRNVSWEHPGDSFAGRSNLYAKLAACRARFREKEGRSREAMNQLLDVAQYGEDRALNGNVSDALVGVDVLSIAQDELHRMLAAGSLSRDNCVELAAALEQVDRGFPREAQAYAIDPMSTGFYFLQAETMEALLERMEIHDVPPPGWRYFFSDRVVLADAFRWERHWAQRASAATDASWAQFRKVQDEIAEDLRLSRNPVIPKTSVFAYMLQNSRRNNLFREHRAQLRLLRTAVAWRATGGIPVLDDPYGDKLRSSLTGNHLKVWSVGGDGVDDGGDGEWVDRKGKDIVLELER